MPSHPWSSGTRCTSFRGRCSASPPSPSPSSSSASCRSGWWTPSSSSSRASSSATWTSSASAARSRGRSSSRTPGAGPPCSTSARSPGSAPDTYRSCRGSGGSSAVAPSSSTAAASLQTRSYWQPATTATSLSGSREVISSPRKGTQGCRSHTAGRGSQGSTLLASPGEASPASPPTLSRLRRTSPWNGRSKPPQDDDDDNDDDGCPSTYRLMTIVDLSLMHGPANFEISCHHACPASKSAKNLA